VALIYLIANDYILRPEGNPEVTLI
jgi:hypothetical protein